MNNTSHLGLPEIQTTMATIVSNDYINSHITHPHPSHSFQPSTYNNGQSTQPFSPYSHISRPNHLCYNSSDTDLSTEIHFLHKQNEKISPRQNQKYIDTPQCLYAFQDSPMPSEKRELSTKSSVSALNESQNLHQGKICDKLYIIFGDTQRKEALVTSYNTE
ncbi:hypothetical protein BDF14DRAFT_1817338 [Spinellus fusiger]|nr:hypothetical protein BDF14DRAFT_1817338 [Spinellus fusiger]